MLLGHDRIARREPEAGALARGLRREERVEDARLRVLGDAWAVVLDLDDHGVAVASGPDRDVAGAAHRVHGVVEEVRPDLVQLAAVGVDRRDVRTVVAFDLDPDLQLVAQDHEGVVDALVQVDRLDRRLPEVRVALQGADDLRDAGRTLADLVGERVDGERAGGPRQRRVQGVAVPDRPGDVLERVRVQALRDEGRRELPPVVDTATVEPVLDRRLAVGSFDRVQVARARCPLARTAFELTKHLAALRRHSHVVEPEMRRLQPGERLPELFGRTPGRGGRVVQLVRDAGREGPEGRHLLALAQRAFGLLLRRHVGAEDEHQLGRRVEPVREHVLAILHPGLQRHDVPGSEDALPEGGVGARADVAPAGTDELIAEDVPGGGVRQQDVRLEVHPKDRAWVHLREPCDLGELRRLFRQQALVAPELRDVGAVEEHHVT